MGIHKLIIQNEGIITGEPLKQFLTEIGFQVPQVTHYEAIPYPPKPAPYDFSNATKESFLEYKAMYDAYAAEKAAIDVINKQNQTIYLNQFKNFADVLSGMFTIATKVKVGGSYQLEILPNPKYTFLQAAQKLMGYTVTRPADSIQFIAFNYF